MKIIQISDLHICRDKNQHFFSQNSMNSLNKIVNEIKKYQDISFVIITGDISQDGSLESYKNALEILNTISLPIYYIPGNHDDQKIMHELFNKSGISLISESIKLDGWEFHHINTSIPGTDCGFIDANTLTSFKDKLSITNNNIVIVSHHHLLPVGTPLVDECMVVNPDDLLKILDENRKIKLVICGHVHGDYKITRKHYCLESSPATCFQWAKTAKKPQAINSHGYKILTFHSNYYESECIFL